MGAKGRVLTGARARLMINGQPVGYVSGFSAEENIQYDEVEALDNIRVEEHVPTRYRVRGNCRFVRLVGETGKSRGHFPKVGANPSEHLSNILGMGTLTINVEDSKTNNLVGQVEDVKFGSNGWNVDAGGIAGHNMEFVASVLRDETEV